MSNEDQGVGIRAGGGIEVAFGRLNDTMQAVLDHLHKEGEPNKQRSPYPKTRNQNKQAANPALTYTFLDMGGPNAGKIWDVRRYAVSGPDPFTTLTGVSVIAFTAGIVPD